MKIFTGDKKNLKRDMERLTYKYNKAKTFSEAFVLYNDLCALEEALNWITDGAYRCRYKIHNPIMDEEIEFKIYNKLKEFDDNFIHNKDFHSDYLENIVNIERDNIANDEYFKSVLDRMNANSTKLTQNEMYTILHDFFKSIGKEKYFDDLIAQRRIYAAKLTSQTGVVGCTTMYNRKTSILLDSSYSSVLTMKATSHEMGHVDDLNDIISKHNKPLRQLNYLYQSIYQESISRLYEKKFLEYLINNDILKMEAVFELAVFYNDLLATTTGAYLLSTLPDEYIIDGKYSKMRPNKLLERMMISDSTKECLHDFVFKYDFDLESDLNYAYGGILAVTMDEMLKEDPEKAREDIKNFMKHRVDYFNPNLLDDFGFTEERFETSYKKSLQKIKQFDRK